MKTLLTIDEILEMRAAAQLDCVSSSSQQRSERTNAKRRREDVREDDDESLEKIFKRPILTSSLTDAPHSTLKRTNTANGVVKPFTILLWNVENYGEHKGRANLFANKIIRHVLDRLNVDVAIILETQSVPTDAIAGLEHRIADSMRTARDKKKGPGPDIAMRVRWTLPEQRALQREHRVWTEAVRVSGLDEETVDEELGDFRESFIAQVKSQLQELQGNAPAFHAITSSVTGRQNALPPKMGPYRSWPRTATREEKKNDIPRFKKIFSYDGSGARPTPHWLLSAYDDLADVYDIRFVQELPDAEDEWPAYDDEELTRPLTRDEIATLRRCVRRLCATTDEREYLRATRERLESMRDEAIVAEVQRVQARLDEIDRESVRAPDDRRPPPFTLAGVRQALDPERIDLETYEDYIPRGREERRDVARQLRDLERAVVLTLNASARAVTQQSARRAARDVIGFVNDGNACYLLAVLQLLNRMPRAVFDAGPKLRSDGNLVRAAEQLLDAAVTQAREGTYGSTTAVHPDVQEGAETNYVRAHNTHHVRRQLQALCGWASAADSEDAHEALVNLLQAFGPRYDALSPATIRGAAEDLAAILPSPLHFAMEIRRKLDRDSAQVWDGEGFEAEVDENEDLWHTTFAVDNVLSLPVPEGEKTFEQAVNEAQQPPVGTDDIVYILNDATFHAPALEQHVQYLHLPDHLLIRLERMWSMTVKVESGAVELLRGKKSDAVTMPAEFDRWQLRAFVRHHGDTPEGGHYTAYVLIGGRWYHVNDDTVTPVQDVTEARNNGYLYYYGPPADCEPDPDDDSQRIDMEDVPSPSGASSHEEGFDSDGENLVSDEELVRTPEQTGSDHDAEMPSGGSPPDSGGGSGSDSGSDSSDEEFDEETVITDECPLLAEVFALDPGLEMFGAQNLRPEREIDQEKEKEQLKDVQDILSTMIGVRNVETYLVLYRANDDSRNTVTKPIRAFNHPNVGHYVFKSGLLSTDASGQELGYQDPSVWINGRCPFYFELDVWKPDEALAVRLPFLALHAPYGMPPEFRKDEKKKKKTVSAEEPPLLDRMKPINFDGTSDDPLKMRADAMHNLLEIGIPSYDEKPYTSRPMRQFDDAIIAGDFNLDMCACTSNPVIAAPYDAMTAAGFEPSADCMKTTLLPVETTLSAGDSEPSAAEKEWFGHAYDNIFVRSTHLKVATTRRETSVGAAGTAIRGVVDVFDAIADYIRQNPDDELMEEAVGVIGTAAYYHKTRHTPRTRAQHELQRWRNNPDPRAQAYFLYRRYISDHLPVFVDLDIHSRFPLPPRSGEAPTGERTPRDVIGIQNAGNSCYLNAALQLLWAFGSSDRWRAAQNPSNADIDREVTLFIAIMAFDAADGTYGGEARPFAGAGDLLRYYTAQTVSGIRAQLHRAQRSTNRDAFVAGRQEDAVEALHLILDGCSTRVRPNRTRIDLSPAALAHAEATGVDALRALLPSPVFFFTRKIMTYADPVQCAGADGLAVDANGRYPQIECRSILQLRLGEAPQTLQELFDANATIRFPPLGRATARVQHAGVIYRATLAAEEFALIDPLPEFLIVQLERFPQDAALRGIGKVTTAIDPSAGLTLPGGAAYDLVACIVHRGISARGGHYVACSFVAGHWWEINDAAVKRDPPGLRTLQREAYVYLLRARGADGGQ